MFLVNALLLSIGGNAAVAATAAVMYLDSVSVMLLIGMSDAMQPAISYCYGAGRLLRVLSLQRWLIRASALVGLFFFCFLEFLGPLIMPLYAPEGDSEFAELAVRCVRIFAFTYLFIWLDITLHAFLTALDCPSYSFILSFSKAIIVPLAGLYLFAYFWGSTASGQTRPSPRCLRPCLRFSLCAASGKSTAHKASVACMNALCPACHACGLRAHGVFGRIHRDYLLIL